jgi:hypothetical protein
MTWDLKGLALAFFTPAVVAAAVSWLFQLLMKGRVDHYFNQQLEKYKHELSVLTEGAKFDYSRKLHDASIFASKRNEVYAAAYALLYEAMDTLIDDKFFDHNSAVVISGYSTGELKAAFDNLEVTGKDRENAEKLWPTFDLSERMELAKTVKVLLDGGKGKRQHRARMAAIDAYRKNAIYMSVAVATECETVLDVMWKMDAGAIDRISGLNSLYGLADLMRSEVAAGFTHNASESVATTPKAPVTTKT